MHEIQGVTLGWNDHLDDSEVSNLPPEAWQPHSQVFDPDDFWLENAHKDDQSIAVREWFRARYCDPAEGTPYNGREGGYQFIHGGPYNPHTELSKRFHGCVADDLIAHIANELIDELGDKWAPIVPFIDGWYDEQYQFEVETHEEPLRSLYSRLKDIDAMMSLRGRDDAVSRVQSLSRTSSGTFITKRPLEMALWYL